MAFDPDGLSDVAALNRGRTLFEYGTRDPLASVLAAGYFDAAHGLLTTGDSILVSADDGEAIVRAAIVNGGAVVAVSQGGAGTANLGFAANELGTGTVERTLADALSELIGDLASAEYIGATRRLLAYQSYELGRTTLQAMATSPTVSIGTASAAATLGGTEVPKGDNRLRRIGGTITDGIVFPMTLFNFTNSLTFADGSRAGMIDVLEFDTDCVQFEFYSRAANQVYRLLVNGELSENTAVMANTGSRHWVKVDFTGLSADPVYRRIRIECDQPCGYAGVVPDILGQIYCPSDAIGLRMVVLGDSFTEGTGADKRYTGYAWLLATKLGIRDAICSGFGGTGYNIDYYPGYGSTRQRLVNRIVTDGVNQAADIYVIAMGINDPVGITSSAMSCIRALRAGRPGSLIYVIGPWNPSAPIAPTGDALTKFQQVQAAALRRIGVRFIDVSDLTYTKSDSTHPNQPGHETIASALANKILADVVSFSTPARAPICRTRPTLIGAFIDGETLYCSPGIWDGAPTNFTFQWKLNGSEIDGATAIAYAVQESDLSGQISCAVAAVSAAGSTPASSAAQAALYGTNILTNGDFSDGSTGWTVTGNWAVAAGKASHTTGAAGNMVKSYTKPASAQIRISFELSGYSANAVTLQNNGANVRSYTANGKYSEIVATPAPGSPTVSFIAGSTFVGAIDNVQVRPVL